MKSAHDLTREELFLIIERLQQGLYLDFRDGRTIWNPDKDWSGADVCMDLAGLLSEHGLVPEEKELYGNSDIFAGDTVYFRLPEGEVGSGTCIGYGAIGSRPILQLDSGHCFRDEVIRVLVDE